MLALLIAGAAHAQPARLQPYDDSPLREPRLTWKSGVRIDGELTAADASSVTWQSPFFTEPAQIATSAVDRIEFPDAKGPAPAATFAIQLTNGDLFYADIKRSEGANITFGAERHGEITLPFTEIASIQRLNGGSLVYAGPTGVQGWRAFGPKDSAFFPWSTGAGGTLITHTWNRAVALEADLSDKLDITLTISAQDSVRFALQLGDKGITNGAPTIETWQDDLVIAQGNRFEPLIKLKDTDRSLSLRIVWDSPAQLLRVHDASGTQLGEFKPNAMPPGTQPQLVLRNKGRGLVLERLLIQRYADAAIAKLDPTKPAVETLTGERIEGSAQLGSGNTLAIGGKSIALTDLLHYTSAQPSKPEPLSRAVYRDGTTLSGDLVSFGKDQPLELRGHGTTLKSQITGLSTLTLRSTAAAPADATTSDELHLASNMLPGAMEGTGDNKLRWRLPGALAAVPVVKRTDIEVRRKASPDLVLDAAPALFFLKDGNVISATPQAILADGITLKSNIAELNALKPEQLSAIHYRRTTTAAPNFTDPQWRKLKGEDKEVTLRDGNVLSIRGNGAFGHPSILSGDEVSFTVRVPQMWAALAVDLFVGDIENVTKGAQVHLICSGTDFWAVMENGDQPGNTRSSEQLRNLTTKNIKVRIALEDTQVRVFANDMPLMTASLDNAQRQGPGLIFRPSSMWGSPTRDVTISDFSVRARPDFVQTPVVQADSKRNALTIPRFRRDLPPTHVLLAPNGDLLRGRLLAMTSDRVEFQSGTETVTLPLDRVAAAVWLDKPKAPPATSQGDKAPAPTITPDTTIELTQDLASHWLILQDGSRLAVTIDKFEKDRLVAWAPNLGTVNVPSAMLASLTFTAPRSNRAMEVYRGWQPEFAPEPVLPEAGGQSSPLIGKAAPDFTLPMIGGGSFNLGQAKGKVVVLDFWATWCGPCVMSMPEQLKAMEQFDPAKVQFIAVNQGEPESVVSKFIAARNWKMSTALDSQQKVGADYGAEAIPHCVVIDPAGKVIWVNTGFNPGDSEKMAAAVKKVLVP